jgi:hypothetical protein
LVTKVKFLTMSAYPTGTTHEFRGYVNWVTLRVRDPMPGNRAAQYRASAAECLMLATSASDGLRRAALLLMAQKWIEKADALVAKSPRADTLLRDRATRNSN